MSTIIQPIQQNDREIFMDVLRGIAIFGILVANLTTGGFNFGYALQEDSPYVLPELDKNLSFIYTMVVEGKFYSIFSLLFGWGIALQIKRGANRGIDAIPTIQRRLFFMLILGTIHMLIWPGDIVLFYAILGFLLLPFRKFSNKTLLIIGSILILSPIALYGLKMAFPILNTPAETLDNIGENLYINWLGVDSEEKYKNWVQHAGWIEILKENVTGFFYRFGYLFYVSRIPKVLGMFLIGFVVGRSDFYKHFNQHKNLLYWILGIGLLIGIPANFALAKFTSEHGKDYYQLTWNGFYQTIAYSLGVVPLALSYIANFMLKFKHKTGEKFLSVLAPVGKMAFTNYMMHSFLCQFILLNAGLGYGSKLGVFYLTVLAILIFTFQIIFSTLWLKYFYYGPVEWVWRSLTYGKKQNFLK